MNSKTSQIRRCIYTQPLGLCDGSQPLHRKEHYLPAALGNFRDDVRLRDYICTSCQQRFSGLEDVFMHHGQDYTVLWHTYSLAAVAQRSPAQRSGGGAIHPTPPSGRTFIMH
jgi:hypothetical protein